MATYREAGAPSQNRDVLNLAAERARRYIQDAPTRRVGPSPAAVAALAELHEPFPSLPSDPSEVLAKLDKIGSAATVTTTGGRYFGFVNGGNLPAATPMMSAGSRAAMATAGRRLRIDSSFLAPMAPATTSRAKGLRSAGTTCQGAAPWLVARIMSS